jgi:hypothetical protein
MSKPRAKRDAAAAEYIEATIAGAVVIEDLAERQALRLTGGRRAAEVRRHWPLER